jgi:hypothetical protein
VPSLCWRILLDHPKGAGLVNHLSQRLLLHYMVIFSRIMATENYPSMATSLSPTRNICSTWAQIPDSRGHRRIPQLWCRWENLVMLSAGTCTPCGPGSYSSSIGVYWWRGLTSCFLFATNWCRSTWSEFTVRSIYVQALCSWHLLKCQRYVHVCFSNGKWGQQCLQISLQECV